MTPYVGNQADSSFPAERSSIPLFLGTEKQAGLESSPPQVVFLISPGNKKVKKISHVIEFT